MPLEALRLSTPGVGTATSAVLTQGATLKRSLPDLLVDDGDRTDAMRPPDLGLRLARGRIPSGCSFTGCNWSGGVLAG